MGLKHSKTCSELSNRDLGEYRLYNVVISLCITTKNIEEVHSHIHWARSADYAMKVVVDYVSHIRPDGKILSKSVKDITDIANKPIDKPLNTIFTR